MDSGRRRSTGGIGRGGAAAAATTTTTTTTTNVVAAGSVWESRMKIDQVKGGFKVFNGGANSNAGSGSPSPGIGATTRRKTWKSESFQGFESIARGKSEVSGDGTKRIPIPAKRVLVAGSEEKTPIGIKKGFRPEPKSDIGSDESEAFDSFQDKAVSSPTVEPIAESGEDHDLPHHHDEEEAEIEVDDEKKSVVEVLEDEDIKTPTKVIKVNPDKVVVSEVKRVNSENNSPVKNSVIIKNNNNIKVVQQKLAEKPISLNVNKRQSPVTKKRTIKFSHSTADEYHSFPETHGRLQSFVDLIMWKDISRSVFIFGIGTFTILSSSYTKDLNISFISVISYLGLVYLAAIFLFRSIICRGVIEMDNSSYVVGEEEAVWLLKLVLPYLNEFLLKLKALFSGDPSTTMKLAVLLFILARCGSSVTIWTMAKLGFFGVFTVPKVCSLYSTQIYAYAKFWGWRFRDAWDTCSHKKGVTIAVFMLVWNLSSILARIWAVFMLFVAFRYYQQNLVTEEWVEKEGEEETWSEPIGVQKQGPASTLIDHTKP